MAKDAVPRPQGKSRATTSLSPCLVSLAIAATASLAGTTTVPQGPQTLERALPAGVYAKVGIEATISGLRHGAHPSVPQLHARLRSLYQELLADPAVTGIAVGEHWDHIQSPSSYPYVPVDGYDWSYLDDVFAVADQHHKPVQVQITPGLDSPPSVLDAIPSCNWLFDPDMPRENNCGTVVFPKVPEPTNADGHILPLPWDQTYNTDWQDFLTDLGTRYQGNAEFASIAVAGPVGPSPEMILPTSANTHDPQVDAMWATLVQHAFPSSPPLSGQALDEVFVVQWDQTIKFYEKLFSGITLVLTPDSGADLPNFGHSVVQAAGNDLYQSECAASIAERDPKNPLYGDLMSCEAKTEVVSYFLAVAGPNGKATRIGGMTASSPTTFTGGDIGIPGVKLLTHLSPAPSPPVGAGAEFDFPVSSKKIKQEGCPPSPQSCSGLTVESAAYNVLKVFFDYTPYAPWFGGTKSNGQVEFLGVPYLDVRYAQDHPCLELQNLLDAASQFLTGRDVACVAPTRYPSPPPNPI